MAALTSKRRKSLPKSSFAIPKSRAYPIDTKGRAVAALGRVKQHGTPKQKAQVRAAVKRRYPTLPSSKGKGTSAAATHNRRRAGTRRRKR